MYFSDSVVHELLFKVCFVFYFAVKEFQGNTLELARISRVDMGAYLCIAQNGVPPAVSKMIKVAVDCE